MSRRVPFRPFALLTFVLLAAACGDSGGETGPTQPAERVASISIEPDSVSLPVDSTTTLEATVRDGDGNVVDVPVDWSSKDPKVATVNGQGQVEALALRPTVIRAVAEDDTARAKVVGAPALTEQAAPIDSTTLELVSEPAERAEGIYRFRVQGDTSVSFEKGQVIVGAQGPGFLREVVSQNKSGGVIELQTEQAALTDVLKAGELHLDMSLEPGEQSRTVVASRAVYPEHVVASRRVHYGSTRVTYQAKGVSISNGKIQFSKEFGNKNFGVDFKGSVGFTPRTQASLAWNKKTFVSGVDSIRVTVGGTATLTAEAAAFARAQKSLEKEATLTSFSRSFTTTVGPVPVHGRVKMDVLVGLRASAGAQAELSTGQAKLIQDAIVTARYKNGSGFSFPTDFSTDFQKPTPSFSSSAKVKARPYVRTDVAVVMYEVIGPRVGPEPYLEGVGEVHRSGPNHCDSHVGIYGGLDVQAALAWGKIGGKAKDLLDIPDVEKQIEGPRTQIVGNRWYCTGKLQIDSNTSGAGTDPNGYWATIDGADSVSLGATETKIVPDVRTGDREVELLDVAPNCQVDGKNPRTVTVRQNEDAHTAFDVTCAASSTNLRVTASTSGIDQDSDGYTVAVDDSITKQIGPNGAASFDSVPEGSRQVELEGVANNCSVSGDNPRTVAVSTDSLASTSFDVSCERALPGRIVFESNRDRERYELYSMNADGTDVTRLTDNDVGDRGAAISPDGEWLAFQHDDNLYKMKLDGSSMTQLTEDLYSDFGPAWSPDGTQLAFLSYRTANNELYTMNADGSDITQLTDGGAQEYSATWSADGERIAFTSEYRDDGLGDIYLIDPDGSGFESVTDDNIEASNIAWSPNGEKIAFSSRELDDSGNNDIYVINADGTGLTRVTDHEAGDNFPSWSPSGEKLAFMSSRDGDREIYVINVDGTDLIQVTDNTALDTDPSWGTKPE